MYLIDEAFNVGKGANSIISMLHHFGEKYVHLHADNCVGQNKNRFLMYYLMWRVTPRNNHFFFTRGTHKVCTRLVLRLDEAVFLSHENR